MAMITFSKTEKDAIVQKIQKYFDDELDQQLGQFDAGFLLNFFADEIGPHFYNKGVQDSRAMLQKRVGELSEAIDSLEKPVAVKNRS